jgi:hypothetical protein
MTPEEHYVKYKNLIHMMAHRHANGSGLDHDDLMSVGHIAYMRALKTHNPEKGKFSTHLTHKLNGYMKTAIREARHWKNNTADLEVAGQVPDHGAAQEGAFRDAMMGLGREARQVVGMIFNAPLEFCDLTKDEVKVTVGGIKSWLRAEGCDLRRTRKIVGEIRQMLRQVR